MSASATLSPTVTRDIASRLATIVDNGDQHVYGAAGLNAMKQGGSWCYYLADGLGSTMAIENASGIVQNSYTYDVYGEASATGALANEFDFAGQQTDSNGLQYLRARYLDVETGMFLSRDRLSVDPKWLGHHFGYAGANPTRLTDPTGLAPCDHAVGKWKEVCISIFGAGKKVSDAAETLADKVRHYGPELAACSIIGPLDCLAAQELSNASIAVANKFFPEEKWTGINDLKDAFRHCV